jgi:hypothetical protein
MIEFTRPASKKKEFLLDDPIIISDCNYERCNKPIYMGDRSWNFDQVWFCSAVCLAKYLGARKKYVR